MNSPIDDYERNELASEIRDARDSKIEILDAKKDAWDDRYYELLDEHGAILNKSPDTASLDDLNALIAKLDIEEKKFESDMHIARLKRDTKLIKVHKKAARKLQALGVPLEIGDYVDPIHVADTYHNDPIMMPEHMIADIDRLVADRNSGSFVPKPVPTVNNIPDYDLVADYAPEPEPEYIPVPIPAPITKVQAKRASNIRENRGREVQKLQDEIRRLCSIAGTPLDQERIRRSINRSIDHEFHSAAVELYKLGVPLLSDDRLNEHDVQRLIEICDAPVVELTEAEIAENNRYLHSNATTMADRGEFPEPATQSIRCPKCHGTQLSVNKRGFGVVKGAMLGIAGALTGGIALGAAGLATGNIGKGKVDITCLKCGHQWKAGNK